MTVGSSHIRHITDEVRSWFCALLSVLLEPPQAEPAKSNMALRLLGPKFGGTSHFALVNKNQANVDGGGSAYRCAFDLFDDRPALFIASDQPGMTRYKGLLCQAGRQVLGRTMFDRTIAEVVSRPADWSLIVVNLDDYGGITRTVDGLLSLRRKAPAIPVILLTSEILFDDYSLERLPIADATLRMPTMLPNFEIGLAEAPVNNLEWQRRIGTNSDNPAPFAPPSRSPA